MLPTRLHADYARLCASLVKIVRVDLQIKEAVYWQPWNNIENDYNSGIYIIIYFYF